MNEVGSWGKRGTRYWVELTSQTAWLIDRCGIKNPDGSTYTKKVDYQPYGEGVFQKNVTSTVNISKVSSATENYQFDVPHSCFRADAEYYLPYYGISESVVDITSTSSWVKVGAIILSLIGVAVSIYFFRLSKKSVVAK